MIGCFAYARHRRFNSEFSGNKLIVRELINRNYCSILLCVKNLTKFYCLSATFELILMLSRFCTLADHLLGMTKHFDHQQDRTNHPIVLDNLCQQPISIYQPLCLNCPKCCRCCGEFPFVLTKYRLTKFPTC
jgi:hypothetical protein